ncbi:MAG: ROK family protein [Ktedonobacteraceae bacterium]|nr:ROK family protein [Ktedonobacteraceae bacterium]MBV9711834.1 ROK family protein [Ktedonobacteraceae bacterium]
MDYNTAQPMDRRMMREMNQNMLLNLIRTHAPISRTQLKRMSGLSLATIIGITTVLIEQQLVVEVGVARSTGGRKAGLLEIYPEGGYVIGIDLREYQIVGTVLNLHGNIIYEEAWPMVLRNNAEQAVDIIAEGVKAFILRSQVPRNKILGLGCGISGIVDVRKGISIESWVLNWHGVELGEPLRKHLGIPIFVDNAVNCLACYEKLYGTGRSYADFLLITLGRGLGMAAVMKGDLFRGAQGQGAEFGHITFDVNGRLCECGNRGCLEAYVADSGVFTTYSELSSSSREIEVGAMSTEVSAIDYLFARAQQGDTHAHEALVLTGTHLGIGLSTLVNLFNPTCVIITNGIGYQVDPLLTSMRVAMEQHIFSQLGENLKLIIEDNCSLINWARGAGCLVLQDFFSSPTEV